jgi:hypothetical protein
MMNKTRSLFDAALGLAEILERENAALRAVDYTTASQLADAKARALGDLMDACWGSAGLRGRQVTEARDLARRLDELAAANRALLERAIVVQRRVIASVVRAIPKPATPRYAATGGLAQTVRLAPVALVARA